MKTNLKLYRGQADERAKAMGEPYAIYADDRAGVLILLPWSAGRPQGWPKAVLKYRTKG
jgi:hypothetical protein